MTIIQDPDGDYTCTVHQCSAYECACAWHTDYMVAIELNPHGVIAQVTTLHARANGYGKTTADAITDAMAKLGVWVKGN